MNREPSEAATLAARKITANCSHTHDIDGQFDTYVCAACVGNSLRAAYAVDFPASAARPKGPWRVRCMAEGHYYLQTHGERELCVNVGDDLSEAEALAVRDALNRVAAEESSPQPEKTE